MLLLAACKAVLTMDAGMRDQVSGERLLCPLPACDRQTEKRGEKRERRVREERSSRDQQATATAAAVGFIFWSPPQTYFPQFHPYFLISFVHNINPLVLATSINLLAPSLSSCVARPSPNGLLSVPFVCRLPASELAAVGPVMTRTRRPGPHQGRHNDGEEVRDA